MEYNENAGMVGEWDFYIAEGDPITKAEIGLIRQGISIGRNYRIHHVKNIIPTVSRQQICKALGGFITSEADIKISHQELGTGTTAPANGDTGLETPTGATRAAISSLGYASNQLNLTAFWAAAGATGTWREFGSFMNGTMVSNSGVLFNRVAINITIAVSESLTIDGTITIT